jgi:hypothetical protein
MYYFVTTYVRHAGDSNPQSSVPSVETLTTATDLSIPLKSVISIQGDVNIVDQYLAQFFHGFPTTFPQCYAVTIPNFGSLPHEIYGLFVS